MNVARFLKQTAVYWANPVPDGYGGFNFDAPVEIAVRWEDRQENFVTITGETHISRAIVFVNQDVKLGEYLMEGHLTDLDSSQNPETQEEAFRIAALNKICDVKGSVFVRKVWL